MVYSNNSVKVAREQSYEKIKKVNYTVGRSVWDTLKTIDFGVSPCSHTDQREIAKYNLELDARSCLGRLAQAAAIAEKHFPGSHLQAAEVRQDRLAEIMIKKLKENPKKMEDGSFMSELLMYEKPHMVLLVDGIQFDPLSLYAGWNIEHPKVAPFPLWEAIASSKLVSRSYLEKIPEIKSRILQMAESICPSTSLVRENVCHLLGIMGARKDLIKEVKWCVEARPCARNLAILYLLTEDLNVYYLLVISYSEKIFSYL
ncbi:MAG: hypothetical protein ACOCVY_00415 [Patescibacteria group bacterium]